VSKFLLYFVFAHDIITSMERESYRAALNELRLELSDAIRQQADAEEAARALNDRIADLRQSVSALAKLCGEEFNEEEALGLTDAIRQIFKTAGTRPLTAQDVRTGLESRGFKIGRYSNILASIHTVIKRLAEKGEIKPTDSTGDKPAYRWDPLFDAIIEFKKLTKSLVAAPSRLETQKGKK
jgi:hypothetical protein